jgi:hypothetical protein
MEKKKDQLTKIPRESKEDNPHEALMSGVTTISDLVGRLERRMETRTEGDQRTMRRIAALSMFIEGLSLLALDDGEISADFYNNMKREMTDIYGRIKILYARDI